MPPFPSLTMRSAGGGRELLALFVCWRAIAGAGRSTDPRRADSGEPVRPLVYPSAAAPRSGKTGRCTAYDADQGRAPRTGGTTAAAVIANGLTDTSARRSITVTVIAAARAIAIAVIVLIFPR